VMKDLGIARFRCGVREKWGWNNLLLIQGKSISSHILGRLHLWIVWS